MADFSGRSNVAIKEDPFRNSEGYADPTCGEAVRRAGDVPGRHFSVWLAGFERMGGMIQIDVMVSGVSNERLEFSDETEAKQEYMKYCGLSCCYALVTVDGRQLSGAEARKLFGLPPIIKHTPHKAETESAFPRHRRRR